MKGKWINCLERLPPENVYVPTKIDDALGCRNEQNLKRLNSLWFVPSGNLYVCYTPTHWFEEETPSGSLKNWLINS